MKIDSQNIKNKMNKISNFFMAKINKPNKYMDLAPSDDIDNDGVYTNALNWAIRNKKVTNIALTGNYGSGKSSVIKTFKKRLWHNKSQNWIINILSNLYYSIRFKSVSISLATFVNEKTDIINDGTDNGNDSSETETYNQIEIPRLLRIEKAILQQMFYSVKAKRIPASRFERINHMSVLKIFVLISFSTMVVFLGICSLNPSLLLAPQEHFTELTELILKYIFNGEIGRETLSKSLTLACNIMFWLGLISVVFWAVKYILRSIRLSGKVSINAFEIQIDKKNDDSIFNKYLDEIIYFFQVCRHNLVIIEDLDRFESVEIFTKLRELNTLINNSEQIKRKVIFVYAIKDDIFIQSKDRTKFFDFIIPIIPAINASNSNVELMRKLKDMKISNKLNEEFIDEISIFIDDMRILKSVVNEFRIYKEKLKDNNKDEHGNSIPLEDEKILAIIVYKNLFPKDFSLLQQGEGLVHRAFDDKGKYLINLIKDTDKKIKYAEDCLNYSEKELLNNISELKLVFLDYTQKYDKNIQYAEIGGNRYNLDNIDFSLTNDDTKLTHGYYNHNICTFKDLQNRFHLPYSFALRKSAIELKDKLRKKELQNALNKLKIERNEMNSYTLSKLIENYGEKSVLSQDVCENPFIVFLLRNAYIDEQHQMYISYFHQGSLTVSDAGFVLNVKYRKKMEPTYRLSNKEKIIKKLNHLDFKSKVTLNYDLTDYLLGHMENDNLDDDSKERSKQYNEYYNLLLDQLVNISEPEIDFIDSFKHITSHKSDFIKTICDKWSGIWDYIEYLPTFDDEQKNEYLKDILMYANISDIDNMNNPKDNEELEQVFDGIGRYIVTTFQFLKLFANETPECINKIEIIIEELELHFETLDTNFKDHTLFNFICDNNFYSITPIMFDIILHHKLGFSQEDIHCKNYTVIQACNYEPLKKYTQLNINQYVKNIILQNIKNTQETEESLLDLLNKPLEKLSLETKEKLIQHNNTHITSIIETDNELWRTLVTEQKMKAKWSNILNYWGYVGTIDEPLIQFLNNESNYLILLNEKIHSIKDIEDNSINEFILELMHSRFIDDIAVFNLLTCLEIANIRLNFIKLSDNRTKLLLESHQIPFDVINYNSIRENHKYLLILFLESFAVEFVEKLEEEIDTSVDPTILIDYEIIEMFLSSVAVIDELKYRLIKCLNVNFWCEDKKMADKIASIILNNEPFEINKTLLYSILEFMSVNARNPKITLLMMQANYLDDQSLFECLSHIGGDYAKIGKPKEKLRFKENELNISFFDVLKQKLEISVRISKEKQLIYVNSKVEEV